MHVEVKPAAVKQTKFQDYAVRFVFGGLVTALAGVIAHRCGPVIGGLFLAFPAIFPASCTLVERHENERQRRDGVDHHRMGMKAAGVDAAGAALGSMGLAGFAAVVWFLASLWPSWAVLTLAMAVWCAVSLIAWIVRKKPGLPLRVIGSCFSRPRAAAGRAIREFHGRS
jgi:hypothetical protein